MRKKFYSVSVKIGIRHKSPEYDAVSVKRYATEEKAEAAERKLRQLYGNIFDVCYGETL